MDNFLSFCGFFMAHAVWNVSPGGILTPFTSHQSFDGERGLTRFVDAERYEDGAENAQRHGKELIAKYAFTAAFVDGFYTYDNGERTDAVHMFALWNDGGVIRELMMSIPYQSPKDGLPFKVYKPKLRECENMELSQVQQAFDSFWDGVDSHTEAVEVWNAALDQSK
jgi:hypothetical protein